MKVNTNLASLLREHSVKINPGVAALMNNAADVLDELTERCGHWIDRGKEKGYFCSICGGGCLLNMDSEWHESTYCPHCGAKMNKEF